LHKRRIIPWLAERL